MSTSVDHVLSNCRKLIIESKIKIKLNHSDYYQYISSTLYEYFVDPHYLNYSAQNITNHPIDYLYEIVIQKIEQSHKTIKINKQQIIDDLFQAMEVIINHVETSSLELFIAKCVMNKKLSSVKYLHKLNLISSPHQPAVSNVKNANTIKIKKFDLLQLKDSAVFEAIVLDFVHQNEYFLILYYDSLQNEFVTETISQYSTRIQIVSPTQLNSVVINRNNNNHHHYYCFSIMLKAFCDKLLWNILKVFSENAPNKFITLLDWHKFSFCGKSFILTVKYCLKTGLIYFKVISLEQISTRCLINIECRYVDKLSVQMHTGEFLTETCNNNNNHDDIDSKNNDGFDPNILFKCTTAKVYIYLPDLEISENNNNNNKQQPSQKSYISNNLLMLHFLQKNDKYNNILYYINDKESPYNFVDYSTNFKKYLFTIHRHHKKNLKYEQKILKYKFSNMNKQITHYMNYLKGEGRILSSILSKMCTSKHNLLCFPAPAKQKQFKKFILEVFKCKINMINIIYSSIMGVFIVEIDDDYFDTNKPVSKCAVFWECVIYILLTWKIQIKLNINIYRDIHKYISTINKQGEKFAVWMDAIQLRNSVIASYYSKCEMVELDHNIIYLSRSIIHHMKKAKLCLYCSRKSRHYCSECSKILQKKIWLCSRKCYKKIWNLKKCPHFNIALMKHPT